MKKMMSKLRNWWVRLLHYGFIRKNQAEAESLVWRTTVSQLWQAGLKFNQINKWLLFIGQKPVVEYYFPNGEHMPPVVRTKHMTSKERQKIRVRIYNVWQ